MSCVLKIAMGLGVLLATAVDSSSAVLAKGVESVSIDGLGLDHPIEIASRQSWTLHQLVDLSAVWAVTPGYAEPVALLDRSPAEYLGPPYTLTWRVLTGVDETTELVQVLYPHADPGPLVYTAAGQQIYDGSTTGGWYRASVTLRELLVRLGVPPLDGSTNFDVAETVRPLASGPSPPATLVSPTTEAPLPLDSDDSAGGWDRAAWLGGRESRRAC